ncbi:helix-turn-helix transcriptional regulator [Streptomyces sp. SPB162]|uniref:helix-turn-helix domain-containing protein n=1 Tax=Streptomyces sp. SPB162 TaxID=2940560 RepID=UPI0024069DA3|nr:helix-turn-helix transcriptional regulator [Streptomyces sp. SPB162]MDF9814947.1 transcriptional regulator with XRE-family HTH domain [Streptomyces sp. SPB162]
MGLRSNPSQRQRRLGAELRRLRELSGMSATDAGALAGLGRAHMSHIEMGRTAIPEEKLRTLADAYGCNSQTLIDALVAMGRATGKGWWLDFRPTLLDTALDFAELESTADAIKTFGLTFIPGLLQTPAYTRALLASGSPDAPPDVFERYAEFRQRRGRILLGESPPQYQTVIHETALRLSFVGVDVLRQQIEHLLELARLPHIRIQIMSFAAPMIPASSNSFVLYEPGVPELGTVHVEHPVSVTFLTEPQYLSQYTAAFEQLSTTALSPLDPKPDITSCTRRDSLGLIQHALYTL